MVMLITTEIQPTMEDTGMAHMLLFNVILDTPDLVSVQHFAATQQNGTIQIYIAIQVISYES